MKIVLERSSAQVLKWLTKRILLIQTWISHKPHKEVLGRSHKGLEMSVFRGWHQHPLKEGGESFYTCPPKTSRWKLASKNWNIQNLKSSRWSQNRTIQFFLVW
jgi:hypothetical protein